MGQAESRQRTGSATQATEATPRLIRGSEPTADPGSAVTPPSPRPARGVIVLGMHRGGTSAVAGVLAGAGFSLGAEDHMPADDNNPAGYFELYRSAALNDDLLRLAGGSWDCPPTRDAVVSIADTARSRVERAVEALALEASPAPLVVKDPRISVLLPAWRNVLRGTLRPILVVRNPLESADSLARRDSMSLAAGLALWELTWSSLLVELEGREVYVVHYDRLVADPAASGDLLHWAKEVLPDVLAERVEPASSVSIRADFRRSRYRDEDLLEYATSQQADLWEALRGLPAGALVLPPPTPAASGGAREGCLITLRRDAEARREVAARRADASDLVALRAECDRLTAALGEEQARVRYLQETAAGLAMERDQRGVLVSTLEAEIASLRPLAEQAQAAIAERDGLRGSATESLRRMREASEEAARAVHEASEARAALAGSQQRLIERESELVALAAEADAMRRSETWRVGSVLVRAANLLLRGSSHRR